MTFPDGTCLALAPTPDGGGYWILNVDTGTITAFGNAGDFGEPADDFVGVPREFVPNSIAIVSTPSGQGYWVLEVGLSGAGTVAPFGDADFFGDTQTLMQQTQTAFNGEPVGLVATPSGQGYWEVWSDGGVFGFGDAGFFGSTGGIQLNKPIIGMAATATGMGYWLIASDGGVFAFGDAVFHGSTGGIALNKPIVGIAATDDGAGYWLAASDGGIFAFGTAPFVGFARQRDARPADRGHRRHVADDASVQCPVERREIHAAHAPTAVAHPGVAALVDDDLGRVRRDGRDAVLGLEVERIVTLRGRGWCGTPSRSSPSPDR